MPFNAQVVLVLIASPSDTHDARAVIRETFTEWNSVNAEYAGLVVLPLMWESDSVPEVGERPQSILNRQLVQRCDVVVATFWTRLGTPTDEAPSGTVEEIEHASKVGKPVLVYFSDLPVVPSSVDPVEYERLAEFRSQLQERALYDTYSSLEQLRGKVSAALTRIAREKFAAQVPSAGSAPIGKAALIARIEREREVSGVDSRGTPRYRTDYRLIIQNRGTAAAENLTIAVRPAREGDAPDILEADQPVGRLAPGGDVAYYLVVHMGVSAQLDLELSWQEDGVDRRELQTLRVF